MSEEVDKVVDEVISRVKTEKIPDDLLGKVIYIIKELGLTTALVAFICYLLAVQLPGIQTDFRVQTNKLVEAVANNTRVMGEVSDQLEESRKKADERAKRLEDLLKKIGPKE